MASRWSVAVLLFPALASLTCPASAQAAADRPITVDGRRMPQAEAPRWATCRALVRDPHFAAVASAAAARGVLGPTIYVPTRLPRNPDYAAAPRVPVGTPLPVLPKTRFGVRSLVQGDLSDEVGDVSPADGDVGAVSAVSPGGRESRAESVAACLQAYGPGGALATAESSRMMSAMGAAAGPGALSGPSGRRPSYYGARAEIVDRDTTLPMGFALFDQGRYAEALVWFRKAEAKLQLAEGADEAKLFIAKLILAGFDPRHDAGDAVSLLRTVAESRFNPINGTPVFDPAQPERNTAQGEAAVILGNLHLLGRHGVAKDPAGARKWFARAFEVGHVAAAQRMGDMCLAAIGGVRDPKRAAGWYRKAAALDLAPAQYALAAILWTGDEGVKPDRDEALAWYRAAARHNHPGALYALARAHDLGEGGVAANPERAIALYKAAALAGDGAAMVAMGTYFYRGERVPRDLAAARDWFEQGAGRADADGMFNLAAMLVHGEGGAEDRGRARVLLRQAAVLGLDKAPAALAALGN